MTKIKDTELSGFTLHGGPPEGDISESEIAQSCPTLCDPMDCSLPGSSVHGVLQARILQCLKTRGQSPSLESLLEFLTSRGCCRQLTV